MSKSSIKPLVFLKEKFFNFWQELNQEKSSAFTGINLGNNFVKGLVVDQGEITDYFIEPKKNISEIISSLKKKGKISGSTVRVSLKDPSCLVRYFPFPKADPKKLEQALYYQLNKLIPYSPDEVCFDYAILKEADPSNYYILLAAARKSLIQEILETFEKQGLTVSEISLDSIALMNLYLSKFPQDAKINSCILDIGHGFSTMNILEKGVPFLSREVKFSAKDIVDIASRVKNISGKETIDALKNLKETNELFSILEENISDWCKEIKNSFDFFELNKGASLDKLYLTGGLITIPQIAGIFSDNLGIDSEILIPDNPGNLKFSQTFPKDEYENYRHNLAVSFGLIL